MQLSINPVCEVSLTSPPQHRADDRYLPCSQYNDILGRGLRDLMSLLTSIQLTPHGLVQTSTHSTTVSPQTSVPPSRSTDTVSSDSTNTKAVLEPVNRAQAHSKRKRRSEEEDGEDDGDIRRPRLEPSSRTRSLQPYMACPFYKRDPHKYQQGQFRACSGPGFPNIPRLKEHLYRRHWSPLACDRCGVHFEQRSAVGEHLRQDPICEVRDVGELGGITEAQMQRLKARNRSAMSEADKWRQIYGVLFPNDHTTPSPFYNISTSDAKDTAVELSELLRVELPRRVDERLDFSALDDSVRTKIYETIVDCQEQLFREFRSRKTSDSSLQEQEQIQLGELHGYTREMEAQMQSQATNVHSTWRPLEFISTLNVEIPVELSDLDLGEDLGSVDYSMPAYLNEFMSPEDLT